MGVNEDLDENLTVADRFFDGLLAGDLDELQAACTPGSVLWINLTEQERPLEASLPALPRLRGKVPDLHMDAVQRRGVPGGLVPQHVLAGTTPTGDALHVVGCFLGTVATAASPGLEEYVDGRQAGALERAAQERLTGGRSARHHDDHLDLDGDVVRGAPEADGGAGISPGVAEHLDHQVREAVDDLRRAVNRARS